MNTDQIEYSVQINVSSDEHAPDWRVEYTSNSLEDAIAAKARIAEHTYHTEIQLNSWDGEKWSYNVDLSRM